MKYEWDSNKNQANIAERGIDFEIAEAFEWDCAIAWEDTRKDYPEQRFVALSPINGRVHVMVFTHREANIRVISQRRANPREVRKYEQAQK